MTFALDHLDQLGARAFDGYLVRKDLVRKYAQQFPVPTYVVEFMLGRYCASIDEAEIEDGLRIVEQQLAERTVRSGEEQLFLARARERGSVRVIDIVRARLDPKNDCYIAELPSLLLKDARIPDDVVNDNERLLTGGFYAEATVTYDAIMAQESGGRPFAVESLRPIQVHTANALPTLAKGRQLFTTQEWIEFLLRSVGFEPETLGERGRLVALLRMIPFVERNFNMVELGPRGTGKSHLFQQISPYAHLVSGGKASVAQMFVNNATGKRGLVAQYDVVCFDEVAGISFDQKDGVNIMKGYMASGQFSRGKENIRADGSIVLVGNYDVDVQQQQKIGHLLSVLPGEMKSDTAFMDRLHAFVPGWDFPKLNQHVHLTDHFGLVSDFLTECWSRLRSTERSSTMQGRVRFGGAISGRDDTAVSKTVAGLLKLVFPDPEMPVSDDDLRWIVRVAMESRRRVKEQQKRVFKAEFRDTHFSYILGPDGTEEFVSTPELHSDDAISSDPLPAGQVWAVSPDPSVVPGLYRIEVSRGPGSSVRILNQPVPPGFRESVNVGQQRLFSQARDLVNDRNPREHEFTVQMRPFDSDRSGLALGLPVLVALVGSLLERGTRGGTIIVGSLSLGGSVEMITNPVRIAEMAADKQATTLLLPVSARRALNDLPDDIWTKVKIEFYRDAVDGVFKALED